MPDLPPAIAAYFAADSGTPDALGACFTPDAVVHDEKNEHHGVDAINAWRHDTQARTPFTTRPLEMCERGGQFIVQTEVSGAFPNSPIILEHAFTLADGLISDLDIR